MGAQSCLKLLFFASFLLSLNECACAYSAFKPDFVAIKSNDTSAINETCTAPNQNATKCDVSQIFKQGDPKQNSMDIALKAAEEAKAANDAQKPAGDAAAQHIKEELADVAYRSAKAAEAALASKEILLQQLQTAFNESVAVVKDEAESLQRTEINMNTAKKAALIAEEQVKAINALHQTAGDNLKNIKCVALGSQKSMEAKKQLLDAAKNRLKTLQQQLLAARDDFQKTKEITEKAVCAAAEAKEKASAETDKTKC